MQAPDPVETILARLMPPALSEKCHTDIEAMLEELAGPESGNVVSISSGKWITRSLIGGGIAAAIGAMCAVFPMTRNSAGVPAIKTASVNVPAGFVLVSESDRIESVTDEGLREDSEGSAMHSLRLKAVQENNVRDEESGMLVRISEPREEILMTPIRSSDEEPVLKRPMTSGMVEAAAVPAENNGPVRVVNIAEKSASFLSPDEGKAVVSREGAIYKVTISGSTNELVFEGDLSKDDKMEQVPEVWRKRVLVLSRTLDQALDGGMMPTRQPQPRVAPPASHKP
ncbi:MAG: hypothetical protein V4584_03585 [Verrucomicrobiota bacterium]